jgi:RNA polymerase-binding transcription factor DksA
MESVPTPTAIDPAADRAEEPVAVAGEEASADEVTQQDIDAIDSVLDAVEQSLTRIEAGTYGQCEECGGVIEDTVLVEDPTARRCQTCPRPALD